jgi:uncharacterized protein YndB with AHSA1/START domain
MKKDIKHTWLLEHPAEDVWEFLTDPNLIAQWLMKNDFKPEVGHKFNFWTKPVFDFDGTVYCEVLEVVPFKKLSYTWKGGSNGKINLDSVVIWTLIEKENGTELTIEHKGFEGLKNFLGYVFMNSGWKKILRKRLTQLLSTAQ